MVVSVSVSPTFSVNAVKADVSLSVARVFSSILAIHLKIPRATRLALIIHPG